MHDWHISVESYRRVHTLLSGYFCIMRTSVLSLSGKNILYSVGIYMHDLHVSAEAYRRVHIVLGMYLCIIPTSCMIRESLLTFTAVYLLCSVDVYAWLERPYNGFECMIRMLVLNFTGVYILYSVSIYA